MIKILSLIHISDDISPENVLRQALELIAKLPLIAVYSYHSYRHFRKDEMRFIRNPEKGLSLAENILLMLRPKGEYTEPVSYTHLDVYKRQGTKSFKEWICVRSWRRPDRRKCRKNRFNRKEKFHLL